MIPFKSQMSQIEPIPEHGNYQKSMSPKKMNASASQDNTAQKNRNFHTPNKFRPIVVHKRKSTMNPQMALTQDMKKL